MSPCLRRPHRRLDHPHAFRAEDLMRGSLSEGGAGAWPAPCFDSLRKPEGVGVCRVRPAARRVAGRDVVDADEGASAHAQTLVIAEEEAAGVWRCEHVERSLTCVSGAVARLTPDAALLNQMSVGSVVVLSGRRRCSCGS